MEPEGLGCVTTSPCGLCCYRSVFAVRGVQVAFQGYVEATNDVIAGWAVAQDGSGCAITMVVNDGTPTTIPCDLDRPDLVRLGKSTGKGGFRIDPDPHLHEGRNIIELRFPDGGAIPNSPVIRIIGADNPETYAGFVESRDPTRLSGWAVTGDGLPCVVIAEIDGETRAQTQSTLSRPDLARSALSRGQGGFMFDLSGYLDGASRIAIRFANGQIIDGGVIELGTPPSPEPDAIEDKARLEKESGASEGAGESPAGATVSPAKPEPLPPVPTDTPKEKGEPSPAVMPSLVELDELSLDDIAYAFAAGLVTVPPPEIPPHEEAREEGKDEGVVTGADADADEGPAQKRPWLKRLLRRS